LCSLSWRQQSSVLHILFLCAQQLEIVEVLMMLLETYLCGTSELLWSESGGEMKMGSISCCSSFLCSTVLFGVLHRLVMQWKNCLVIYSESWKQPGVMLFVLRDVVNDE
jgi:hypothetical protein